MTFIRSNANLDTSFSTTWCDNSSSYNCLLCRPMSQPCTQPQYKASLKPQLGLLCREQVSNLPWWTNCDVAPYMHYVPDMNINSVFFAGKQVATKRISLVPRPSTIISVGGKDSLVYTVCACANFPPKVGNEN